MVWMASLNTFFYHINFKEAKEFPLNLVSSIVPQALCLYIYCQLSATSLSWSLTQIRLGLLLNQMGRARDKLCLQWWGLRWSREQRRIYSVWLGDVSGRCESPRIWSIPRGSSRNGSMSSRSCCSSSRELLRASTCGQLRGWFRQRVRRHPSSKVFGQSYVQMESVPLSRVFQKYYP